MRVDLQELFCRKLTIGFVYIYENDVSQIDEIGPLEVLQFNIINIFSRS